MLGDADLIGFIPASDLQRARRFYAEILGLTFVRDDGFALVLSANGNMLRVVAMPAVIPAPYTVLGWEVGDLRAAANALAARGVVFERYPGLEQDALGIWTAPNGNEVAWFKDPDGNVLSISRH